VTPSLVREDRVEVDAMASTAWYDRIAEFKDANLYQVWHDSASGGRFGSADRVALTRGGDVVGAAEVRLMRFPLIRGGIAYVLWGPLSRRGEDSNPVAFRQAVRALREEYVVRRGMVLRINPRLVVEQDVRLRGVKSALRYADRASIDLVVIVGQRERQDGTVVVRNMRSRQETVVARAELTDTVQRQLG